MGKPKNGRMFKCEHCGNDFYRAASYIASHQNIRFCSSMCHKKAIASGTFKPGDPRKERPNRRLGKMLACAVCGTEFYRKNSEILYGVNKTCSVACRSKWLSGERNHFFQQFKNIPPRPPQWSPKQRAEWLADSCCRCGATEKLELDHIIPRGPHTRENTQTLCRSCNQRKAWNEDRIYYRRLPQGG